jgi:phosphate transport system substrate-binding protein
MRGASAFVNNLLSFPILGDFFLYAIITGMLARVLVWVGLVAFLLSACAGGTGAGTPAPQGTPQGGAYIQNKGSDTIVNLALAWAERYQQEYPDVRISVTGGGSGTGIAALINGTVDIANASRKISDKETADAQKNGITPVEHVIARDAIGVIVNPHNPVSQLTLQQVSDIYSGKIDNWAQVGGENRPIVRLSRESNSGTHVYFLETVVRLGDSKSRTLFDPTTLLLPSSEGIIAEVRDNPNAIGYDGLGYIQTGEVKIIALSKSPNGPFVLPAIATVNDHTYPVSRDLYMYTGANPSQAVQTYMAWLLTAEAQKLVQDLGFVPVSAQVGAAQP